MVFFLLRLVFLPLAVAAGDGAERILVLRVDPGELWFFGLACEVGWGPPGSRMDLLCCVFFFGVAGLGRFAGVEVVLWFSGFVVAGGVGADSKTPTAVPKYRGSHAAYQGWKSALRVAKWKNGGSKSRRHAWRKAELRRQRLRGKTTINSRFKDLAVISVFLRVLSARKACTVLLFSI